MCEHRTKSNVWRLKMSKLATTLILCSLTAAPAIWAQLPDGPGKDVVTNVCSECHSLDLISAMRMNGPGWRAEVDKMIARGATASPEEIETIVTYLAGSLGPQAPA